MYSYNNDPLLNVQRLYSTKNNYSTSLAGEREALRAGGLARCPTSPGGNELSVMNAKLAQRRELAELEEPRFACAVDEAVAVAALAPITQAAATAVFERALRHGAVWNTGHETDDEVA